MVAAKGVQTHCRLTADSAVLVLLSIAGQAGQAPRGFAKRSMFPHCYRREGGIHITTVAFFFMKVVSESGCTGWVILCLKHRFLGKASFQQCWESHMVLVMLN